MTNLIDFTLNELVNKIKSKEISSKDVTSAYIERSKSSKKLNTYIEETFEQALKDAKRFDSKPDFEKKLPLFLAYSFQVSASVCKYLTSKVIYCIFQV